MLTVAYCYKPKYIHNIIIIHSIYGLCTCMYLKGRGLFTPHRNQCVITFEQSTISVLFIY